MSGARFLESGSKELDVSSKISGVRYQELDITCQNVRVFIYQALRVS